METYVGFSVSTVPMAFFGRLIAFFQKGKSHCFVCVYHRAQKKWIVVDATIKGVRVRGLKIFLKENKIISKYFLPELENSEMAEKLKEEIIFWGIERTGLKYPIMEVVGNGIQILVKCISIGFLKVKNPFRHGQKEPRCNELVAMILKKFYNYEIKENLDDIDLLYLENILKEHSK